MYRCIRIQGQRCHCVDGVCLPCLDVAAGIVDAHQAEQLLRDKDAEWERVHGERWDREDD
jgi:hypothetical protein